MDDSLLVSIFKMERIVGIIFENASLCLADFCLWKHSALFPWLL